MHQGHIFSSNTSFANVDCLVHVHNPMRAFEASHDVLSSGFVWKGRSDDVKELCKGDMVLILFEVWLRFLLHFVVLRPGTDTDERAADVKAPFGSVTCYLEVFVYIL